MKRINKPTNKQDFPLIISLFDEFALENGHQPKPEAPVALEHVSAI